MIQWIGETGVNNEYIRPSNVTSSAFTKALYGQKTSTHHGKYVYRKRGILDDYVRLVEFTEEDWEVMGLQID